jgi:hypothetical protein
MKLPKLKEVQAAKEKTCKGYIVRATVNDFYHVVSSGRNQGDQRIGSHITLRRLKRDSCAGCEECGWMEEVLNDINEGFQINGINEVEHGKKYSIEANWTPCGMDYMGDVESDGFYLVEVKEKK